MGKIATIVLSDGREMKFELCEQDAPISVENFISLARKGFYNGLIFHRVIPDFMVQGGGMNRQLEPKEEGLKPIKGEFRQNGVSNNIQHKAGVLSMARTMIKDSATSQFFICVTDVVHLDGAYAGFGKATDKATIDVAVDISKVKTTSIGHYDDVPLKPIEIKEIKISE